MVSSRPETEWDETEAAWMVAAEAYRRQEICHLCGWPKAICQSRDAENGLTVPPPTRCHVTTAIKRAQEARQSGPAAKHDDALLWGARLKE